MNTTTEHTAEQDSTPSAWPGTKIDRNVVLVRSAQRRADVIAFLNSERGSSRGHTLHEMCIALEIDSAVKKEADRLRNLLDNMVTSGLIAKSKAADNTVVFHNRETTVSRSVLAGDSRPLRKPYTRKPVEAEVAPAPEEPVTDTPGTDPFMVKIDLVKATGKLRLTFRGLRIEIGVE